MRRQTLTDEERRIVELALLELQNEGSSTAGVIDRDFLIEDGNIDAFMLYYFPNDFFSWEPINQAYFSFLENNNEGQAWLPAGHGKTTMTLLWLIYVMCREPDISEIYTEKSLPVAQSRMIALQTKLQNPLLVAHYGDFKGPVWSSLKMVIRQRRTPKNTPTLAVYGSGGGSVLGERCNIEINDDPVTDENNASEKERDALYRWFTKAAATSPAPLPVRNKRYLKKHFLVGTVFGPDDLYHRVLKSRQGDPNYAFLHLKAVDEATGDTLSPRFCYIEPEELARRAAEDPVYAALEEKVRRGECTNLYVWRQANGSYAFYQRYQNIAVDPEAQKFPEVWFTGGEDAMAPPGGYPGCIDETMEFGVRLPGFRYVTGVDPAGSTGAYSVRFACVTLGFSEAEPNKVYVADIDFGKYPLVSDNPGRKTQVDIVLDHVKRFDSRVVVETNNIQGIYRDVLRAEAAKRNINLRITGSYTSKRKKVSFSEGIEAMQPMIENGNLRIPFKTPHDKRKARELIDEFVFLGTHGTDDIVMAAWLAWTQIERLRSKPKNIYREREVPAWMMRGDELVFPPSWDERRIRAFLGLSDDDDDGVDEL